MIAQDVEHVVAIDSNLSLCECCWRMILGESRIASLDAFSRLFSVAFIHDLTMISSRSDIIPLCFHCSRQICFLLGMPYI